MGFKILILLFWFDPKLDDGRGFQISHLDGKPLAFNSSKACYEHVDENYENLKSYVESYYEAKATISKVKCVPEFSG